jgi:hypothetical protein
MEAERRQVTDSNNVNLVFSFNVRRDLQVSLLVDFWELV